MRLLRRALRDEDITVVAGAPVTTPRQTVVDLIERREDLSLIAAVLRDAESSGTPAGIDNDINPLATRCGFPDGFDLYGYLGGLR